MTATQTVAKKAPARKAAPKTAAKATTVKKVAGVRKAPAPRNEAAAPTGQDSSVIVAVNMVGGKIIDSAAMSIPTTADSKTAAQLLQGAVHTDLAPTATEIQAPSGAGDAQALTPRQLRRKNRKDLKAANLEAAASEGLRPIRRGTKRASIFEMLAAPTGATIEEIVKSTGEAIDSVRTVLTKNVKGKGYEVLKEAIDKRGDVMYLGLKGHKITADKILYAATAPAAESKPA